MIRAADPQLLPHPQSWWRRARASEQAEQASTSAPEEELAQSGTALAGKAGVRFFPLRQPALPIRRFLREVTFLELQTVRKMASLSAFAYFIPSVTVRGLEPAGSLRAGCSERCSTNETGPAPA